MQIIAHRGNAWLAPENTIAAFESAHRTGADMIELDVQVLADGNAAVIHNDTVDDTTDGTGPVNSLTSAELSTLDAGSWFSPSFSGEAVPLFTDVVSFVRDHPGIRVLVEFKGVWPLEALSRVTGAITEAGLGDRFVLQSFEEETLALARDHAPELAREWLLGTRREDAIDVAYELDVRGVNPSGTILLEHPDFVDEMHGAGLGVAVWTLNEPQQWAAARTMGVDAIITDRPSMLRGWLSAHG